MSKKAHKDEPPTADSPAGPATAILSAAHAVLSEQMARPLAPGLYLVATPIGNLADMTLRGISVLARADLVCCEDTRHSRKLLQHFAIARPLAPFHEHNEDRERARILALLGEGRSVAMISDAGTPLVADPGYKLVRAARAAGVPVWSIPGPSSVLAALTVSGQPTDSFFFEGFLPAKPSARLSRLRELALLPASLVIFESPHRIAESLVDMATALGATRSAAVARELTKLHEEVHSGTLTELADWSRSIPAKGEVVVVVGPPLPAEVSDAEIERRLAVALEGAGLSEAARGVARELGVARARVYAIGVARRGATRR
jgi:16S rRNA (cytidine1402-2'-O)-methyltransferase